MNKKICVEDFSQGFFFLPSCCGFCSFWNNLIGNVNLFIRQAEFDTQIPEFDIQIQEFNTQIPEFDTQISEFDTQIPEFDMSRN